MDYYRPEMSMRWVYEPQITGMRHMGEMRHLLVGIPRMQPLLISIFIAVLQTQRRCIGCSWCSGSSSCRKENEHRTAEQLNRERMGMKWSISISKWQSENPSNMKHGITLVFQEQRRLHDILQTVVSQYPFSWYPYSRWIYVIHFSLIDKTEWYGI